LYILHRDEINQYAVKRKQKFVGCTSLKQMIGLAGIRLLIMIYKLITGYKKFQFTFIPTVPVPKIVPPGLKDILYFVPSSAF